MLRRAACIGRGPSPVGKSRGHVGYTIAAFGQHLPRGNPLRRVLALVEERISEPAPVARAPEFLEQRFVLGQVGFELVETELAEMRVRPCVIAEDEARRAPFAQRLHSIEILDVRRIDEAGDWNARSLQRRDHLAVGLERRDARRIWRVHREVVDRDRDLRFRLLRGSSGTKDEKRRRDHPALHSTVPIDDDALQMSMPASFANESMRESSSSVKSSFRNALSESSSCATVRAPMSAEVTRGSRSTQAIAICAIVCPRDSASSFSARM